jgi:cytidylate kinase
MDSQNETKKDTQPKKAVKQEVKQEEVVLTASQYAETKGIRRLETFLKRKFGNETKTLAEWEKVFKAEKYI